MTTIKDRVLQIAENKGISKEKFFKDLDLSYANFKGVQKRSALSSDSIVKILSKHNTVNSEWLLTGEGPMLKEIGIKKTLKQLTKKAKERRKEIDKSGVEYQIHPSKTDTIQSSQMIPLYELDAVAGIIPVMENIENQTPIDHVYIPNAPKCDGALYATGDSMYPLLKSGDILAFKIITDFLNDVFFGEMYILFIEVAGDLFRTVKFVHKGENKEHFKLVSQNKHHQDKEVHISKVKAMAQVKASIRLH